MFKPQYQQPKVEVTYNQDQSEEPLQQCLTSNLWFAWKKEREEMRAKLSPQEFLEWEKANDPQLPNFG